MSDIDLDKYRRHVAHFDMAEDQKTELLQAVWRIMQSFVDRAFGDDPVQHVIAARNRLEDKSDAIDASDSAAMVDSPELKPPETPDTLTGSFRDKSGASGKRKR